MVRIVHEKHKKHENFARLSVRITRYFAEQALLV